MARGVQVLLGIDKRVTNCEVAVDLHPKNMLLKGLKMSHFKKPFQCKISTLGHTEQIISVSVTVPHTTATQLSDKEQTSS